MRLVGVHKARSAQSTQPTFGNFVEIFLLTVSPALALQDFLCMSKGLRSQWTAGKQGQTTYVKKEGVFWNLKKKLGAPFLALVNTCGHWELCCLLLNTQTRPHVLVHHVANADGWYDFHEIGQDAAVKSKETLLFHNLLHHQIHRQLLWALNRSWEKKGKARWVKKKISSCLKSLDFRSIGCL